MLRLVGLMSTKEGGNGSCRDEARDGACEIVGTDPFVAG